MLKTIGKLSLLTVLLSLSVYAQVHYVAIGAASSNVLLTSPDGFTWTRRTGILPDYWITAVTHANGLWVVLTSSGQTASSPDGITWTQRGTATYGYPKAIAFGNGVWVIVGASYDAKRGKVWTSADLSTWTSSSPEAPEVLYNMVYGNGLFVATGDHGYTTYSSDGLTWTRGGGTGPGRVFTVFYGNGWWLAGSDYKTLSFSTTGKSWTTASYAYSFIPYAFAYGNGNWIALGGKDSDVASSADGTHWTRYDSGLGINTRPMGMLFDGSKFVTVGAASLMATSTNGIFWTTQTSPVESATYYGLASDLEVASAPVNHTYVVIAND